MAMHHYAALPRQFKNTISRLIQAQTNASTSASSSRALLNVAKTLSNQRLDIYHYVRWGDPAIAARLRENLGLSTTPEPCVIPNDLFGPSKPYKPVSANIIIPVFNAFSDIQRLLQKLPGTLTTPHHIYLIDDASTDTRIRPLLEKFANCDSANRTLASSNKNKGFVDSANRGMNIAIANGNPLVLLNSDAMPPVNWLPRLLAPFEDSTVASVTPVSNSAEILSIPGANNYSANIAAIDEVAQTFGAKHRCGSLPTGIGFCLALNPYFIKAVGFFDPAFGRGYGEEVDWCQRTRDAGGHHVAVPGLFVGHKGGASFGTEKSNRLSIAAKRISSRYPGYDTEIAEWMENDPIAPQRLALSLAALGARAERTPLYIGHRLGGGAEAALQREIKALKTGAVVIRPGGRTVWEIEVYIENTLQIGAVGSTELMLKLLAPITQPKIVYSCGVGAINPLAIPELLQTLATPKTHLHIRLHDYFPISPSYCLLDADGQYRGPPNPNTTNAAHNISQHPERPQVSLKNWQSIWKELLDRSQSITAFSYASRDILAETYPSIRQKICVRPHTGFPVPTAIAKSGTNLGVLGGINRAKGGEVLQNLGRVQFAKRIIVIGDIDSAFHLPEPHLVLGKYKTNQIIEYAQKYGIGAWLIPSIWPETFSFTTHEALATCLPVMTFPLGAQAEAAAAAPNGHLLSSNSTDPAVLAAEIEQIISAAS